MARFDVEEKTERLVMVLISKVLSLIAVMNVPKGPYCISLGPSRSLELMPSRRLTDRIRELCAKAASAPPHEVDAVLGRTQCGSGRTHETPEETGCSEATRGWRLGRKAIPLSQIGQSDGELQVSMSDRTTPVIRCPYCRVGNEFRQMTTRVEGWLQCENCGHNAMPLDPEFRCTCEKCAGSQSKAFPAV